MHSKRNIKGRGAHGVSSCKLGTLVLLNEKPPLQRRSLKRREYVTPYRKAKKHINRRKVTTTSSRIRIDDSLSLILCDMVEAAVHSASYNDYNQPDDGITYYYVINGKAAIHHYPWPDFPIENPEINNIRRLWDIYEAIVRTIVSHNPETSSELKDDIISLTASFLKP